MSDFKFVLTLDLRPFAEGFKSAGKIAKLGTKEIKEILSGIKADIDEKAFDAELKKLDKKIKKYESEPVEIPVELETKKVQNEFRKIVGEVDKSTPLFKRIQTSVIDWGFSLQSVSTIYHSIANVVNELLEKAEAQEKAEQKVEQAVRSTGAAAGFSAGELKNMAAELQEITVFGDEDILNNVTAQLLTFTNIAGDQFKEAQMAAMNLATVLDGDLKSASIQLGKALNDPIANLSALSRSGIQFTQAQKDMVKELWNAGEKAKAQSIILEELNKQYGGQAQAMATTYTGALQQYTNLVSDLKETLGDLIKTALVPVVKFLSQGIKAASGFFRSLTETPLETTIRELEELGAAAEDIIELKKFVWKQQLIDINAELEKAGINYENIKDVTAKIKSNTEKIIEIKKIKAEIAKDENDISDERMKKIAKETGLNEEMLILMRDHLLSLGQKKLIMYDILTLIGADVGELKRENENLKKHADLLIQREALERKINQTLKERNETAGEETAIIDEQIPKIISKAYIIRQEMKNAFDFSVLEENIGEALENVEISVSDWILNIRDKLAGGFSEIDWNTMLSGLGAALQAQLEKANQYVGALKNLFSNLSEYRLQKKNQELRKEEQAEIRKIQKSKKTEEEKEKAIAKIKEKYAQKRVQAEAAERRKMKPILIAEAIANTALAVTKALPNLVLAGIAAATGAIQIATIKEQKFASGGLFRGYGGPKDDANLIRVSNGEYIVNAEATKRFFPLLNAINFGKYAVGGLVRGSLPAISFPTPAFANGGVVSGGSSSYRDETGGIWREIHNTLQAINMNLIEKKFEVNTIVETTDPETRIRQDADRKAIMEKNNDAIETV